jgi:hypothetical protein
VFGHKNARPNGTENDDVEVCEVIGCDKAGARHGSICAYLNAHSTSCES